MKIRADYVTNSSSSSFISIEALTIKWDFEKSNEYETMLEYRIEG